MTFFESLLVLLMAAIVLLQVARRAGVPYPALLAIAGVAVAFVPGAPEIRLDPQTALALFIAPALLDAAFDYPIGSVRRLWRPLTVMAVVAVIASAAVVTWIGWRWAGLPVAAALVMGAIVAPPDAAAASAILGQVTLPRRTEAVLKGESLFNDASALLLFNGALALQASGHLDAGLAWRLALAVPGGLALGVASAFAMRWLNRFVAGTLGGNLLQFVNTFAVWVVAERLGLSAVLAVIACAMTVAASPGGPDNPRMRVHSFAVWATVVFLLNVLAFLLMGMQARLILARLPADRLWEAARVLGLVLAGLTAARFAVVMGWNRLAARLPALRGGLPRPTPAQGVLVAWSGMRGLVTLATAFALPTSFPQRDLVVLVAFGVVLATLAVQGLLMMPLIRWTGLDRMDDPDREMADARAALVDAADAALAGAGAGGDALRLLYATKRRMPDDPAARARFDAERGAGRAVVAAQRRALDRLRRDEQLGTDIYYQLQEELDWRELTLMPEDERRIEEA